MHCFVVSFRTRIFLFILAKPALADTATVNFRRQQFVFPAGVSRVLPYPMLRSKSYMKVVFVQVLQGLGAGANTSYTSGLYLTEQSLRLRASADRRTRARETPVRRSTVHSGIRYSSLWYHLGRDVASNTRQVAKRIGDRAQKASVAIRKMNEW